MRKFKLSKFLALVLAVIMMCEVVPVSAIDAIKDALTEDPAVTDVIKEEKEVTTAGDDNAYAVEEKTDKREANVKNFLMSDGTYVAAQYPYAVHYLENDAWVDIDNTMIDSKSDSENAFENKNNSLKVKFAKNANKKELVSIKDDKYKIGWEYLTTTKKAISEEVVGKIESKKETDGDLMNLSNLSSAITYYNIEENIDLQYVMVSNTLKENVIINSKLDKYEFSFALNIKNLKPEAQKDGSINFIAEDTGKVRYVIPAPYMYDSTGAYSEDVTCRISQENGQYIYTISANEKWINSEERVFPVVVDPEITDELGRSTLDDATISKKNPTTSYFSQYGEIYIGGNSIDYGTARALIKFTLPTLSSTSQVVSASYYMKHKFYSHFATAKPSVQINVSAAKYYWQENSVTWNSYYQAENGYGNGDQGTILDTFYSSQLDQNELVTKKFDITTAVQGWLAQPSTNNGLLLRYVKDNESEQTGNDYLRMLVMYISPDVDLDNSEYTAADLPYVQIKYIDTAGLNAINPYKTYDIENAGTVSINEYNGNVTYIESDLEKGGNRLSASIYHVYNSSSQTDVGYGIGWDLNIREYVQAAGTLEQAANYDYFLRDEDGTLLYFKETDTTDVYADELGYGLTLNVYKTAGEVTSFTVKDYSGTIKTYSQLVSGKYYLTQIQTSNGDTLDSSNCDTLTIQYTNSNTSLPTIVTDASGRVVTLTYNSSNVLSFITDSDDVYCRSYSYTSNSNGYLLTGIIHRDDNGVPITYLGYSTDNSITVLNSIRNDYMAVGLEYYTGTTKLSYLSQGVNTTSLNRIMKAEYLTGQSVFTYAGEDYSLTAETDNIKEYSVFDTWGQKITSYATNNTGSKYYGVTSNEYSKLSIGGSTSESELRNNNKLLSSYSVAEAANLISDGSFEASSWNTTDGGLSETMTNFGNTTTESYFEGKSGIITPAGTLAANKALYKTINLPAGTYTLSSYFKTVNMSGSVFMTARIMENDVSINDYGTSYSLGSTDAAIDNGWRKLTVTLVVPSGVGYSVQIHCGLWAGTSGTVYFDGVQLESGDIAHDFNLLENSGFEGITGWSLSTALTSADSYSTTEAFLGAQAYKITSVSGKEANIYQTIDISRDTKSSYVLSGWADANSVHVDSDTEYGASDTLYANFSLRAECTYTDNTMNTYEVDFDKYNTNWQYASISFDVADGTKIPSTLVIYCCYESNENVAYFDNIQLLRTETTSYQYNADGQLSAIVEGTENTSVSYSSNNEANVLYDSNGCVSYLSYANSNPHRLTKYYSLEISSEVEYDQYGNVTKNTQLAAKIAAYGIYYIRSSFYDEENSANIVLDVPSSGSNSGLAIQGWSLDNDIKQQYRFIPADTEGIYFYISPVCAPSKYIGVTNASTTAGATIELQIYTGATCQQWKFEKNSDGSYLVVPKNVESLCLSFNSTKGNNVVLATKTATENTSITMEMIDITESQKGKITSSAYTTQDKYASDPIVSNRHYYARIGYTTNFFCNLSDTTAVAGNAVTANTFTGNIGQQLLITKIGTSDYYTVSPASAPTLSFGLRNNSITAGTVVELQNTNTSSIYQQWKIIKDAYGTGCILVSVANEEDDMYFNISATQGAEAKIQTGYTKLYLYRVDGSEDMLQMTTETEYTTSGQYVSKEIDERGSETTYTHNEASDQITSATDANGNVVRYEYTSSQVKMYIDRDNDSVCDTNEEYIINEYTQGRTTSLSSRKTAYTFAYDAPGNLTDVLIGTNSLISYDYANNGFGNLNSVTYGNGTVISYTYDSYGRVITQTNTKNNVSHTYTWTYDELGNVKSMADSETGITTNYYYDLSGNLISTSNTLGQKVVSSYETANENKLTSLSYIWGSTINTYGFTYKADKTLDYLTLPTGKTITPAYDTLNRIASVTINTSSALSTCYSYLAGTGLNTTNLVDNLTVKVGTQTLFDYDYTYDSVGNITSVTKNNLASSLQTYVYDDLGQLVRENRADVSKTITYSYDTNGNMLSKTTYAYTTGSLDGLTPISTVPYVYGDTTWGDKLTSYNGTAISYDEIGNPLTYRDGMTFTWKDGRRLATASNSTYNISYTYNLDGMRMSKLVTVIATGVQTYTQYFYQGNLLIAQKMTYNYGTTSATTNEIWFMYDSENSITGFYYNETEYYYVRNLQGDVVAFVNGNGTVCANYSYDAWGNVTVASGPSIGNINPIRYRGYYYDTEIGLYYLQSRYYDATVCRFINADEQINDEASILGANLSTYCYNNPVNYDDPCGHRPGDFFSSPQAAVIDFAKLYYNISLYIRMEIVSTIYNVKKNNKTYYSYTQYTICDVHQSNTNAGNKYMPKDSWRVGVVHTHTNSSFFSDGDITYVTTTFIPLYVVLPNMSIRVYHDTRRGFRDDVVLSRLLLTSLTSLTKGQMTSLKNTYQNAWNIHIKTKCAFRCDKKKWPAW